MRETLAGYGCVTALLFVAVTVFLCVWWADLSGEGSMTQLMAPHDVVAASRR